MSGPAHELGHAASTPTLQAAVEQALASYFGRLRRVVALQRRPSTYRSSFPLEEFEVRLEDGTALPLMFKDLSPHALPDSVRRAKPEFVFNPLREIAVYGSILDCQRFGTACCYGAVVEPEIERYWLFLEKVPGLELYQLGDLAAWQQAARWIATLHARFLGRLESLTCTSHLLRYDGTFYRRWIERARQFQHAADGSVTSGGQRELERLASRYDRVVERLLALPATLIHGEFYASNVLVQPTGQAPRVCAVDWEMAAIGPGLIDLAALTAGQWSDEDRMAIALAYHNEQAQADSSTVSFDELLESLDFCRLHLAVQWLGWSLDWTPPPEHRQDWFIEALRLSGKLGLT
jgi:hypothetical protein